MKSSIVEITARPKRSLKPLYDRPTIDAIPERVLMVKMLERALLDLTGPCERGRKDAYCYLMGKGLFAQADKKRLHSVEIICEQIGFNLEQLRDISHLIYKLGIKFRHNDDWSEAIGKILLDIKTEKYSRNHPQQTTARQNSSPVVVSRAEEARLGQLLEQLEFQFE